MDSKRCDLTHGIQQGIYAGVVILQRCRPHKPEKFVRSSLSSQHLDSGKQQTNDEGKILVCISLNDVKYFL